jgi:taurine dioxygenase
MLTEKHLSPSIGSQIENIDVRNLDAQSMQAVKKAFLQRGLLVFPGQHLMGAEVAAWGRCFGEIWASRILKGLPEAPEVLVLTNTGKENTQTEYWHYDSTYTSRPPAITVLSAVTIPECGGDTMWCDQYAVLEALSPAMQTMLRRLKAVHYDKQRHRKLADRIPTDEHSIHPVVRTHPETGRKCLYLGDHAQYIVGMDYEAGRKLIEELNSFALQADLIYEHEWQVHQLLIWDNRCLMHKATTYDPFTQKRVIRRCTVLGEIPH